MTMGLQSGSLRARLVLQLLVVAAVLAVLLFFTVRYTADRAAEATQDAILGAATTSVAEQLRAVLDAGRDRPRPTVLPDRHRQQHCDGL